MRVRFIILESVPSLAPSPWGAIFDLIGSPAAFSKSHPAPNAGLYTFIVPSPAGADVSAGDSWFTSRVKANGAVNVVGLLADGTPIVYNWALAGDASLPLYESLLKGKGVFAGDLTFVPNANDPAASDVAGTVVWQKPATAAGPGFTAEGNILGSRFTPPDPTHTVFNSIPGNILLHFTASSTMAEVSADLRADGTATSATTIGFKFRASNKVGVFAGKASVQPKSAKFTGVVLQKQHVASGFVSGSASGSVLVTPRS